jgi:hypothetical protein
LKSKTSKECKIEEVIISSSDISSDESGDSDCIRYPRPSPDDAAGMLPQVNYPLHGLVADTRSVVTPPVFQMDGKMTLKEYLVIFEKYFSNKFRGDSRDKSQMLAKFITGDLLRVYEIRGGSKMDYEDIKEQLLQYYRKKRIGGKSYWRKELAKATPEVGEGYDIFGMRLSELAQLAYPENKKECARNLRHVFLQALPSHITEKILDAESGLKASSNTKSKYLTFSGLMEMAKDLQDRSKTSRTKTIMWASQPPAAVPRESEKSSKIPSGRPREYRSQPKSPRTPDSSVKSTNSEDQRQTPRRQQSSGPSAKQSPCSYCKRSGHHVRECWRASKSCLICGSNHFIEDCPRYDPNYRSRSQPRRNAEQKKPLN